jgi:general secretion pathway protein C
MQLHALTLAGAVVVLAMSIALAWQTADWLRFLRTPALDSTPNSKQQPAPANSQQLVQLFGADGRDNTTPPPATDLRLTLLGSFVHADPGRSSAIIRHEGSQAQRYQVGSEMPNGIRLHAVYADRVEVERNGRRESLNFPRSQSSDHAMAYPPSETSTDTLDQLDELEADNLEQLRERMDALRQQMDASGASPTDTEPTDQPTESD